MKRSLLIVGGTLSGLGAVFAITPPQFGDLSSSQLLPNAAAPSATIAPSTAASGAGPKSAPGVASASPSGSAQGSQAISGTFTGDPIDISYGIIQVAITVRDGQIVDAQAVQIPGARNDRWTNKAVPVMRQKTLSAQSSQITGVSGASYTSFGWHRSLQSALTKAGLPL